MKNIILATAFLFALAVSSFGKDVDTNLKDIDAKLKDVDTKLLKDLTATFKNSPNVQWSEIDNYLKAAFSFNGKEACAFYTPDKVKLIGFCVIIDKEDLDTLSLNAIKQKYPDWAIVEAIMIVDAKAYSDFFYHVRKENKDLAFKVKMDKNGRPNIYDKIRF
jgi:hypothetical protein